MQAFTKTIHPADVNVYETRKSPVFCRVDWDGEKLSITGVIGPTVHGNAAGGCGQIDMEFAHRNPADDDSRYGSLYRTSDMRFAPGWTATLWLDFLDVWKRWHLNTMQAACEHQRALGWTYDSHHGNNPDKPFAGDACPECGYLIGSAWLTENVPADVLDFLHHLPDTDRKPAWV